MLKERYFTPQTLQSKSQELYVSVSDLRQRHANIRFRPANAALLVLDLQEYFLQENSHAFVPSASALMPGISELTVAFLAAGCPVIATRHLNTPNNAGMMAKWWRDVIKPHDAYSHNITIANSTKIIFITKPQYDAFFQTQLEDILRERGIGQVVICGVMTHLCCETTARSAFTRGFEVFFTIDGTATYNEQLHRASLMTLSHGFAIPVLIDELVRQMESNEA